MIYRLVVATLLFGPLGTTVACKSISTPLYSDGCPFRQLNFTSATEKDSLSNTVSLNDTLVASLKADLKQLQETGKVGNNLTTTIS